MILNGNIHMLHFGNWWYSIEADGIRRGSSRKGNSFHSSVCQCFITTLIIKTHVKQYNTLTWTWHGIVQHSEATWWKITQWNVIQCNKTQSNATHTITILNHMIIWNLRVKVRFFFHVWTFSSHIYYQYYYDKQLIIQIQTFILVYHISYFNFFFFSWEVMLYILCLS